jgi:hypothetical protein
MGGAPYRLTFNATSVDGSAPDPAQGCSSDIKAARYLDFSVLAQ